MMEGSASWPIQSVWISRRIAKVTVRAARDKPGVAADLFQLLSDLGINAEMILSGPASRGHVDVAFLVMESDLPKVTAHYDEIVAAVSARDLQVDRKVALVVFLGSRAMSRTPGVAARVFSLLAEAGANIELISTSLDSLCTVIREDRVDEVIDLVREKWEIEPQEGYYLEE